MTIRKRYGKQSKLAKKSKGLMPVPPKGSGKGIRPITTPVWDLYRDGITYSMMSKFIICRERFRLATVEGLSYTEPKDALEFGTAFHHCLEHVANGGSCTDLKKVLNKFIQSKKGLTPDQQNNFTFLMRVCEETFRLYYEHWKEMDSAFKFVVREETFEYLYPVPGYRTIKLRGRIDAAYASGQELWLMENKTKGRIDEDLMKSTLSQDMQTMFYCLALEQKFGKQPDGVLYNVIRRSGLRKGVKESDNVFLERTVKDIKDRPAWYFMRWKTQLMPGDLDVWKKRTLEPLLVHICRWWESIMHNPFNPWETEAEKGLPKVNVEHWQRPFGVYDDGDSSGGRGDFFELLTKGSYYGLYRRSVAFPELESV